MKPQSIIFVANSPGEISGWLAPLVYEARQRWPECRLVLQTLACDFATGAEGKVAKEQLGIDEVHSPAHYFALLLYGMPRYRDSIIIHLGGDLVYSALLSRRWQVPLWVYVWGKRWLDTNLTHYFVRHERDVEMLQQKQKLLPGKVHLVGDLVADATAFALQRQSEHLLANQQIGREVDCLYSGHHGEPVSLESGKDVPVISFLPGSREHEVAGLSPFYLEIASLLQREVGKCRFQLIISPYIDKLDLRRLLTSVPLKEMGGIRARFDGRSIWAPDNTHIRVIHEDQLAKLSKSTLALTIPGTKTSELACLGVPMLSILPFNRPDLLPMTGILGLLDFVPGGRYIKGKLLLHLVKKPRFFALPNILAQCSLVPELVGVLKPRQVADKLKEMLSDSQGLGEQSQKIREIYAPHLGAAQRLFDILERC